MNETERRRQQEETKPGFSGGDDRRAGDRAAEDTGLSEGEEKERAQKTAAADSKSRLGTAPLRGLIMSMALPTVAAQLVNLLYNIVDRIYVGHIPGDGTMALAGLGITFPALILITAFSNLVGMGGSNRASIAMGRGDYDQAERILGNCVTLILGLSVVLGAGFMAVKIPLLRAFGASEATLPYADSYLTIYLMGTLFVMTTLGLNNFITNQGFAKTSMLTTCIGAALNIILDPVFIFGFGMGVEGAAIATVISQAVSALWVVCFFRGKRTVLRIRPKNLRPSAKVMGSVISLGISPFVMSATECLIQLTFNQGMVKYGNDLYVSLMSIMFSVNQGVWMPMQGFAQGVQPIIGYNYGAGNYRRVWKSFYTMLAVCLGFSVVIVGSVVVWPELYLRMFTSQAELIELGKTPMRVFMLGMIVIGAQSACQQTFLGLGQAKISVFIAMLRKVILLWPLALLLPRLMNLGVWGLYLAEPISDLISVTVCTTLFFVKTRKWLRE